MRFLFLFSVWTLSHLGAAAQDNATIAKKILDEVNKRYAALPSSETSFSILIENAAGELTDSQVGKVYVKGDKYHLETDEMLRMSDGVTIWTYFRGEKEVQITAYEGNETEINLARLYKLYEKGYLLLLMGEESIEGQPYQIIDLTPMDRTSPYFKIRLMVSKTTRLLFEAKIFSRNGTHYTYRINKIDTKPTPRENSYFIFDTAAFGDIEINDLR